MCWFLTDTIFNMKKEMLHKWFPLKSKSLVKPRQSLEMILLTVSYIPDYSEAVFLTFTSTTSFHLIVQLISLTSIITGC